MTGISTATMSLPEMCSKLSASPDYRVLKRFTADSLPVLDCVPEGAGICVVLDTETTGKESSDKLIELGMVAIAFDRSTYEVFGVTKRFNGLDDPGLPISPEASAVNGITDEMLAGQRIPDQVVEDMLEGIDFVVAHNSKFDRPYCEARFPLFSSVAWACSFAQVPWADYHMSSTKLEYIAYKQGFFYDAHRAEIDCLALVNALRLPLGETTGFKELAIAHLETSYRIWARNAPFDRKDLLKSRGYRWQDTSNVPGGFKSWYRDILGADFEAEFGYLKDEVYRTKSLVLPVEKVDAFTRFSTRSGASKPVTR